MSSVAILMVGHLRTWKRAKQSFIEKILYPLYKDNYTVDLYVHTYHSLDFHRKGNDLPEVKESFYRLTEVLSKEQILDEFRELPYNTAKIAIEDDEKIIPKLKETYPEYIKDNHNLAVASQLNSINTGFKLIENPEKYKYIIKTRPDLIYDFNLSELLPKLKDDEFGIPQDLQFQNYNDMFAVSSPKLMSIYCDRLSFIKPGECAHSIFKKVISDKYKCVKDFTIYALRIAPQ